MTAMRSSGAGLTMTLRARRERVLVIAERADTNAYPIPRRHYAEALYAAKRAGAQAVILKFVCQATARFLQGSARGWCSLVRQAACPTAACCSARQCLHRLPCHRFAPSSASAVCSDSAWRPTFRQRGLCSARRRSMPRARESTPSAIFDICPQVMTPTRRPTGRCCCSSTAPENAAPMWKSWPPMGRPC